MGMSIFWFAALIIFGIIEAATVGLASIWFALGSLAGLIASALGAPVPIQILAFLVVSCATLLLIRPLGQKYLNSRRVATNADRAIGQHAVVTEAIDNLKGQGHVSIAGVPWSARSETSELIPAGATVQILRIEGVKVFVTVVPTEQPCHQGADSL